MLQKTYYCNNCGEKIEVTEKSRFDGGRFCGVCRSEFPVQAFGSKVMMLAAVIIGVFGIGSLWRGGDKPLNLSVKQIAANSSNQSNSTVNQTARTNNSVNVQPTTQTAASQTNLRPTAFSENKQKVSAPVSNGEASYYCGAMTKKGTPCSRRVKGGGRCWQHQGQSSMLPPEKLLITQ